jgi:hypothetical protein
MRLTLAIALAATLLAAPAAAKELKQVPARLDPSKAYVLVEMGAIDDTKVQGQLVIARYDATASDVLGHGRSQVALDKTTRRAVRDVTIKGIIKDKRRRLHLLELEPDLYVVEGTNGTAFSLGSRTFRAAPGTVTDLGVISVASDYAEGEGPDKIGVGDIAKMALFGVFAKVRVPKQKYVTQRGRQPSDLRLPGIMAGRARPVSWETRNATFGNHLGGLVNRMGGRAERVANAAPVAPVVTAQSLSGVE